MQVKDMEKAGNEGTESFLFLWKNPVLKDISFEIQEGKLPPF